MSLLKKKSKRNVSFWNSEYPLVSERVRVILNHPQDSKELAASVRRLRRGEDASFTLSSETLYLIKE